MAISPRPSTSLIAARAFALPMLARSAIRATGSEHFPLALGYLSNDSERGQCGSVQVLSHISRDDDHRSKKLTTPHYPRTAGSLFLLVSSIAKVNPLLALD